FSKFGNIKLGSKTDDKEFGTFSWAAMLFAAGIGSSILYWGMIEWAFYYQGPPFGITPESDAAIPWASSYGIFQWGPIAWAIYTLPALPIAYFYYVRRTSVLKI
ncbi:BCCT family transporter, partial [Virgibacillus salexigens]|uniref:BCCT family transporter n=1 Tax=Virgibacillus salexigens TaxID=61016 RepID=UPI00190A262B